MKTLRLWTQFSCSLILSTEIFGNISCLAWIQFVDRSSITLMVFKQHEEKWFLFYYFFETLFQIEDITGTAIA